MGRLGDQGLVGLSKPKPFNPRVGFSHPSFDPGTTALGVKELQPCNNL